MDVTSADQLLVRIEVSASRPVATYWFPEGSVAPTRPMDLMISIKNSDFHWRSSPVESNRVVVERHGAYGVLFDDEYNQRIVEFIYRHLGYLADPLYEVVPVP